VDSNKLSKDRSIAARLWTVSQTLTGIRFDTGRPTHAAIA
jgi:hypothetical protein